MDRRFTTRLGVGSALAALVWSTPVALTASKPVGSKTNAFALTQVVSASAIRKRAELRFRQVDPGASEEVIPPSPVGGAAGLNVVGPPHQAYLVSLPEKVLLRLEGVAGSGKPIGIGKFTSHPTVGWGILGPLGNLNNWFGATRERLDNAQPPGAYAGSYTLTVIYP